MNESASAAYLFSAGVAGSGAWEVWGVWGATALVVMSISFHSMSFHVDESVRRVPDRRGGPRARGVLPSDPIKVAERLRALGIRQTFIVSIFMIPKIGPLERGVM